MARREHLLCVMSPSRNISQHKFHEMQITPKTSSDWYHMTEISSNDTFQQRGNLLDDNNSNVITTNALCHMNEVKLQPAQQWVIYCLLFTPINCAAKVMVAVVVLRTFFAV